MGGGLWIVSIFLHLSSYCGNQVRTVQGGERNDKSIRQRQPAHPALSGPQIEFHSREERRGEGRGGEGTQD